MTRRRLLFGIAALAAIIAAPIAWYLISPLFITRTVNEDFPAAAAAPAVQESMTGAKADDMMMPQTAQAMPEKTSEAMAMSDDAMMAKTPDAMMAEKSGDAMMAKTPAAMAEPTAAPSNEPRLLRMGQFHPVEHEGRGMASIYQLPDGRRVLRLEDFEVLNGPDLYVWLSSAADASDARTILDSQYVSLGRLKGNQGNQNYELPADLDVSAYHSVTIWCRRFSVNFATAPLK
ncbi:MAG TPA: DM13 domain-containing protein [Herpetosiphonaceae bacterium]